jgi:enamine deaminase RidA (YjgF/YER057c/UK114 family)
VVDGKQHYQEFNDARSRFYGLAAWGNGYPAATGIGTYTGGVVVELFAVKPKTNKVKIVPLNNKFQVAAHAYSQDVLVGQEDLVFKTRTTPKFERGKVLFIEPEALVYISGTAAIRGEDSLNGVGVEKQTIITMENINYLVSSQNLEQAGVSCVVPPVMKSLRIYLKDDSYYDEAKQVLDRLMPNVPSVYLLGDICRDNLLIEIEGIATNF